MTASELGWSDFAVATAGAAAALAGLIIVAMSVNVSRILASVSVPARAAAAIASLTAAVATSCLMLIPGQPLVALGIEVLVAAVVQWILWVNVVIDLRRDDQPGHPLVPRVGIPALAPAVFTVGGVLLALDMPAGLAWVAAGSVVAVVAGVLFAWIALIEILR